MDEIRKQLSRVQQLADEHEREIESLQIVVYGDPQRHAIALLKRVAELEKVLSELLQWRRDVAVAVRILSWILGLTGVGVWIPLIQSLLKFIGEM